MVVSTMKSRLARAAVYLAGSALLAGLAAAVLPQPEFNAPTPGLLPGHDLDAGADEPLMATAKRCSRCRAVIPRASRFCALCGAAQLPAPGSRPQ